MAKYHESGTICEATVRECPLGVASDDHIEASSKEEFETKLAERFDAVAAPVSRELSPEAAIAEINSKWESLAATVEEQLKADGIEDPGYFPHSKPVMELGRKLNRLTEANTKTEAKRKWENQPSAHGSKDEAYGEAQELHEEAFGRKIGASGTVLSYNLATVLSNAYLVEAEGDHGFSGLKYQLAADDIREKMRAIGELRRTTEANAHRFSIIGAGKSPTHRAAALRDYYKVEGTAAQKALIEREEKQLAKSLKGKHRLTSEYSQIYSSGMIAMMAKALNS